MKIIKYLIPVILSFLSFCSLGQLEPGLYHMQHVPQKLRYNPAFIPIQGGYIGLPGISGIETSISVPFSFYDVFEKDSDDSLSIRVSNVLSKISRYNVVRVNSVTDLLSVGTRLGEKGFFLDFSVRSRVAQDAVLPSGLFNLLWYGNTYPEIFGSHVNIAPEINFAAWDEFSVNFAGSTLKNKLSYGVRLSYLSGRFNINTRKASFDFYTDSSTYNITLKSDLEINTSGVDGIEDYLDQPWPSIAFPGNHGFSVSLGVNYNITPQVSVNASLLDLGSIRWRKQTLTFVSHDPGKEFSFDGLDLHDFVKLFEDPETFAKKVEDSLRALVEIDSVYDVAYTARIPWKINVGGSYRLNDRHRFNLLFNGTGWNGVFRPALSLSYSYTWQRFVELMLSYNMANHQYTNFGGGLAFHVGPLQLYAVTENITSLIFYKSFPGYSFHVGLNILLNRNAGYDDFDMQVKSGSE